MVKIRRLLTSTLYYSLTVVFLDVYQIINSMLRECGEAHSVFALIMLTVYSRKQLNTHDRVRDKVST